MDIEDEGWVNVPYDGLLEVHDDGGKEFFPRKFVRRSPKSYFKMDYFNSSQRSQELVDSSSEDDSISRNNVITFPIQLDDHHQIVDQNEEDVKEITKLAILINDELKEAHEADLDPIFKVFFKKENEFVEMKMDSPRATSRRITIPCIETDMFQYQEDSSDDDHIFNCSSPSSKVVIDQVTKEESNQELNIWKWGLNGIGTICSLGMAAATICIIIFGNGHRHTQNHKIRIQLYSDDKRIKKVVQHANEAMSAARGVPLTTAHITHGGHYDGFVA